MEKTGVPKDYFSVLEGRHDLLVDAAVEAVTQAITEQTELLAVRSFRVDKNVASGSDPDQKSQVRVFRFQGQSWSQVMCAFIPRRPFELGKAISQQLSCRCLDIEVTDDEWGGYVLFDCGDVVEIEWQCVGEDLLRFLPKLGISVPEIDEDELYEGTSFFQSQIRPDAGEGDLNTLAKILEMWIDPGTLVWAEVPDIKRLDLLYAE